MTQSLFRQKLYEVIFGTDTPAGKRFDVVLIIVILLSVLALMLDSTNLLEPEQRLYLLRAEWVFTVLFTIEYGLRIYCSPNPWRYVRSFYGIIDLLSVLPTYISLLVPGASYFLVVRLLRVLRVFRVLKLVRYLQEADVLGRAIMLARRKIFIFFFSVLVLATVFGSLMFAVEGPDNGFTSIPKSIYWTIVTITTVGYGDIVPQTIVGQFIATLAMLTGYSIIAIPTGIFTAELTSEMQRDRHRQMCHRCKRSGHDRDANYCKYCGAGMGY